ncbi:hypothetical protein G6F58_013915 [Rhizopus delemar]|nr:hypothetical protein G6F58_013915 [Rhizopus delemar]
MSLSATRLTWPALSNVPASVPMMEPPCALTVMVMPSLAWISPRRMLPLGESRPTVVSLYADTTPLTACTASERVSFSVR